MSKAQNPETITAMASLTELPNELVLDIISQLEYDRPTLVSFAKTSRHFYDMTQSFVFRHVELSNDKSIPNQLLRGKAMLLDRSFSTNPDLLKNVWSCDRVVDETGRGHMNRKEEWEFLELERFERYPNLKEAIFYYQFVRRRTLDLSLPTSTYVFDSATTQRLKSIKLVTPHRSGINACIRLQNLRTLILQDCDPRQLNVEGSSSSVRQLHILTTENFNSQYFNGETAIRPGAIGKLLISFPALRQLCIRASLGIWLYLGNQGDPGFLEVDVAEVTKALGFISANVEVLELVCPLQGETMETFNHPLQLQSFPKIRRLTISAICVFKITQPYSRRENVLPTFLPPGLEDLHIVFPREIGVFYDYKEWLKGVRQTFPLDVDRYRWILQIPALKKGACPRLRKVCLSEDEFSYVGAIQDGHDPCGGIQIWEPADEVRSAYAHAEIKLDIKLCMGHYENQSL
ncbi:hypothetical protein P154DRAFT_523364 [Amniculicola lignicola CBS 123094]|uniref:Uncharacterized protein n=1 Tax=Amniculicola lignicola CBS 123094 TaxID=1392246 RepID=A0A6A5WJP0_9PLEO|nr:hypothetical protein P154DRAFT_523364 [Amniculicola lignicola CBS 123094]